MRTFWTKVRQSYLLVLPLILVSMPASPSQAVADKSAAERIEDIERALATAVLHVDVATLERTYAEDFRFTHSTGDVQTKAEWLKDLASGESGYTARRVDSIEVELHGDVAITTGRVHARTNSSNPRWQEYTIWYVRVYALRDGRWQLLSHRTVREETGPLPTSVMR